ncbi:hypothetical protein [Phyllobacterium myrsinacearum]|uniref:Protein kinase domain-containing protein n=1 Tax=Phyllobacterium myrsinacearum TaxID=28101 RepID=A0A839ENN7_9HYPH|nr:hypothetical protein [Phyllobacterium myrsinacearum]MBA8881701.1 hypothetical protein [Phyllobacterium myrsinacearum]
MTNYTPTPLYDWLAPIQEEFNHFMLGGNLGQGKYRNVYAVPGREDLVYKIETPHAERDFCNVTEWNVWHQLKDTPAGQWLAPCHFISRSGSILVMERTKEISAKRVPKQVPDFCTDVHQGNWGLLKNRPVMHDYGFLSGFISVIRDKKKFKMVENTRV